MAFELLLRYTHEIPDRNGEANFWRLVVKRTVAMLTPPNLEEGVWDM